jgi:hypothetical protein
MEALLRQSRGVCPFLAKTSPATLRSLSTSAAATAAYNASAGGSRMSNLQVLARRCPVMGKALAVRSGVPAGVRSYHRKADRANFHSASVKGAQAVNVNVNNVGRQDPGKTARGTRRVLSRKIANYSLHSTLLYSEARCCRRQADPRPWKPSSAVRTGQVRLRGLLQD